jgi:nitrite reductase (NADH) small subunit
MHVLPPRIENRKSKIENEILLCSLDDLPLGLGRAFTVAGKTLALFRTRKGSVFATDNACPHKAGPLADGMLSGDAVVCPLHTFKFDLRTGACDQEGPCPLKTYPLQIKDNTVYLHLEDLT